MDRNKEVLLKRELARQEQIRIQALTWLLSLLYDCHGGQATIELATAEAMQKTIHQVLCQIDQQNGRMTLIVADQQGKPEVMVKPASLPAAAIAEDLCSQSPDGIAHLDAVTLEQILEAYHDMAVRAEKERHKPLVAPELPREKVERCLECGWAYGEHKDGCSLATAPLAAAG